MPESGNRVPPEPQQSSANDPQTAELNMRRALGLNTRGPAQTPQQRPEQARQRHRFVQDGGVPVVVLNHRAEESSPLKDRLGELQTLLETERTNHANTRRALTELQTAHQAVQTRLAHAELAHREAIAQERRALAAAQEALAAAQAAPLAPVMKPPTPLAPVSRAAPEEAADKPKRGRAPHPSAARAQAAALVDTELQGQDQGLMHAIELKVLDPRLHGWGLPRYQTEMAAAIDLHACLDAPIAIAPGEAAILVHAGIAVHIGDPGFAAVILPRSGLGHRQGLVLGNTAGLIDADYTGPIMVSVWNRGSVPIPLQPGDRFAQMMFVPIARPGFTVVEEFTHVSRRGAGGFGSTG